jgi:hypothetical protein
MIQNRVRALMTLLATLAVPATMFAIASPASAAPSVTGAASQPRAAAAASARTASASPQTGNTCGVVADATKVWLQNKPRAHIGIDANNYTYVGVSGGTTLDEMFDFIRVGKQPNGDPVFKLQVVSGNTYNCFKCPVSTGSYLKYKSCTSNGSDWIERPVTNGFRLENSYVLRTSGKAEYMAVRAPRSNYRLLLAPFHTDWQLWNAV